MSDVRFVFRPLERWPREQTANRERSPFTRREYDSYRRSEIGWSTTRWELDRELRALYVSEAQIQLALTEADLRIDGEIRANASLRHPGVVLSFKHPKVGPVIFACDRWTTWQANIRGITKGLEALRLVERYGIVQSFEQYTGWRAIGAGTPMPAAKMSVEDAARFLIEHGESDVASVHSFLDDGSEVLAAYRRAAKRLHPDQGGDPVLFRRLQEAREVIEAHG